MGKLTSKKPKQGFKAVIIPDVHIDQDGYAPVYGVVKRFIADWKPDKVYLLGDFANCGALSHWNLQKKRKCENKRHMKEIDQLNKELDFLQKYSKKIVWLEGNHENWVEQYLDRNPESEGLLEYPEKCRLAERGIEWIPYNELYKVGKLYMTHGRYVSKYHASKHAEKIGANIVYGHTHVRQTFGASRELCTEYAAWGLGCLCDKKPDYLKGKVGNWMHQFAILFVASNGDFNLYPVDIIKGRFYWAGKRYD